MRCQGCGCVDSKVIDSRLSDDGCAIRRRRECIHCQKRFTTYEKIESTPILVIKSNGNRQVFDPQKIKSGILKACEKRSVSMADIDKAVENVEKQISSTLVQEVKSSIIGELVMNELKRIDDVAYIRFASVYRHFKDIDTLKSEIDALINDKCKK